LYDAIEYVAIGAYVALFVLINVQVFWRYVLNDPLSWPEEVARALFIWISYLGLIKVVREQSSYRIDFLAMRMPGPLRLAVATVVDLVTLTFFRCSDRPCRSCHPQQLEHDDIDPDADQRHLPLTAGCNRVHPPAACRPHSAPARLSGAR
jgi:hypothetical protein